MKAQLEKLKEFKNIVAVDDFARGEIRTKVRTVNGVPLLPVPSARMRDKYIFKDGKADGQKEGGFAPSDDAKQLNWIVMPRRAPIAVCKQDKCRIFSPDQNKDADAWQINYRKYHDIWVKDSYKDVIRTSIGKILTKKGADSEVQA